MVGCGYFSNANRQVGWVIYGAISGLSVESDLQSRSDGRQFQLTSIEWYACREKENKVGE